MYSTWEIKIDDYLAIVKICQDKGMSPGSSMEKEFIAYMKEKGQKPCGHTELNREEIIKETCSHNKNVLNIETDSEGKHKYIIFKKKDDGLDKG